MLAAIDRARDLVVVVCVCERERKRERGRERERWGRKQSEGDKTERLVFSVTLGF